MGDFKVEYLGDLRTKSLHINSGDSINIDSISIKVFILE